MISRRSILKGLLALPFVGLLVKGKPVMLEGVVGPMRESRTPFKPFSLEPCAINYGRSPAEVALQDSKDVQGLTVAKLREAKRILEANECPHEFAKVFACRFDDEIRRAFFG